MQNSTWETIRVANQKYLNMPPQVSDYIAVQEILKLCSSGLSNKSISNHLEMDEEYVSEVLFQYLDFSGWQIDLDLNCLMCYESAKGNYKKYRKNVSTLSPSFDENLIMESFFICKIYSGIKEEIDKYYD